ncbi:MAG TPA: hypothetical protein VIL95_04330, partial [Bacillota bacterium]
DATVMRHDGNDGSRPRKEVGRPRIANHSLVIACIRGSWREGAGRMRQRLCSCSGQRFWLYVAVAAAAILLLR